MTQKELYKIASDLWDKEFQEYENSTECNANDRMFWINGFMTGFTYSYATTEQDLSGFINKQKDLDPEYGKIISDNFNDLI